MLNNFSHNGAHDTRLLNLDGTQLLQPQRHSTIPVATMFMTLARSNNGVQGTQLPQFQRHLVTPITVMFMAPDYSNYKCANDTQLPQS